MRIALLLLLVACDRGGARDKPDPKTPSTPLPAPSAAAPSLTVAGCSLTPVPLRRPAAKRVVAVGDLHGDLAATRSALRAAGVIDDKDAWIGKDTVVVQTGDVLDRGDDEREILELFFKLEGDARAAGGEFIMLLGNHELMNPAGDFRYVTPGAMADFGENRIAGIGPGSTWAKKLAQHDVVAIVGDTLFAHAGVLGKYVTQVDAVNLTARCWLDGQTGGPRDVPMAMQGEDTPVWTRRLGLDPPDCAALAHANEKLGIKRQVIGHTVQKEINAACDGAVWRIDVGLAKLYGGPIQVLEIVDGTPKVLTGMR